MDRTRGRTWEKPDRFEGPGHMSKLETQKWILLEISPNTELEGSEATLLILRG